MNYSIRPMLESDINAVYAIETEVHISPWNITILRDCVRVGYHCILLEIPAGDNVIAGGYLIARIAENKAHILNFCIAKQLQSQGYGRILLSAFLDALSPFKQIKEVILEVRRSNHVALHLYTVFGFEQVEVKKGYYNDGSSEEDAVLLRKCV